MSYVQLYKAEENAMPPVFDLHIPERRRPFCSILNCPERLLVAWHKDCRGIHELLDEDGRASWGKPQEGLWQIREYRRTHYWETGAHYA